MKKKLIIISIIIITIVLIPLLYIKITATGEYYKNEKNINIPIFIYHDIVEKDEDVKINYMQTTYTIFKEQISGLMNLGYTPISYDTLIEYNNGTKKIPARPILITFDDGFEGVYKYAFEFAKEKNIPMTSFVINYNVGSKGYYTWENAKEMEESGLMTIASHSMKHLYYDKVSMQDLSKDVNQSLQEINEKTGKHNKYNIFTYPYGAHTKDEQSLLKENEIIQNLTDDKINTSSNLNIYGLHRMYPLSDPAWKLYLKIDYRAIKYK